MGGCCNLPIFKFFERYNHQLALPCPFFFFDLNRTTKRPVPLEHCLFYSGELYKICENEKIILQGLKAAKDAHKKKNSPTVSGSGPYGGSSTANERARRHESSSHAKQNKHSQNLMNFSGNNNWGSRRSEASVWLSLINKLSKMSLLPVCLISYLFIFFFVPSFSRMCQNCTCCYIFPPIPLNKSNFIS